MQVYAWRGSGSTVAGVEKPPDRPWAKHEVEGVPATRVAAETIFDRLLVPIDGREAGRVFRVGVLSDLSPAMGAVHDGLTEMGRLETPDRVHLTSVRGRWESLHVVYRTQSEVEARAFARVLVDRADARRREGKDHVGDGRLAGLGELHTPPFFVFVLLGAISALKRPEGRR